MVDRKTSGLDIDLGNLCSETAYGWAKKTFVSREMRFGMPVKGLDGSFSNLMNYGQVRIAMSSDGIGTKAELAERTGIYDTLGYDLIAMVVDDLAANGIEPTNLSNILDVDHLDVEIVDALMRGLHDASMIAGLAVVGGEIAELGERISGYGDRMHFNWCATGIGILPAGEEPINGSSVQVGDAVVSLESMGFRSNGFSLVRRIMAAAFGPEWHRTPHDDRRTWGEVLLTRSRIFAPWIVSMREQGIDIHGIAHVTGGGIPDNLGRVLRSTGLGAHLDALPPPLPFMAEVQALGEVPEETAYRLWNMGTGMLVVLNPRDAERMVELLGRAGCPAVRCGSVTGTPGVILESRGVQARTLVFTS
ncbi:MAG: AIR synthase-related protein [Pseudomonadota bacterium]